MPNHCFLQKNNDVRNYRAFVEESLVKSKGHLIVKSKGGGQEMNEDKQEEMIIWLWLKD